MSNLKTASVLAFERKLSNSDALMFSGEWDDRNNSQQWKGIVVEEKSVRGTISNRQKNAIQSDPAKLDQEVQKANLQTVDVSALPFEHDTLKVQFTLRVLGNAEQPSACNDQAYQSALEDTILSYVDNVGYAELAKRYATNLASGRFLWRNRVGAEAIEVVVSEASTSTEWTFNSYDFVLAHFNHDHEAVNALAQRLEAGLKGEGFVMIQVQAFVRLGHGQEVFPSQELILDSASTGNRKSKTLYEVNKTAAVHSQKIGNAIRTIDDWYPESDKLGPISVEPFGSVTNRGRAFRQPKQKMDFYTLLDNWVLKGDAPDVEQQHYVVANLIRGGVYGEKSE